MNPRESHLTPEKHTYVFIVGLQATTEYLLTPVQSMEKLRELSLRNPGEKIRCAKLEASAVIPTGPQVTYY